MPSVFDKLGIQFQYPENWTLDEDAALEGCQSVTVLSPNGAFWTAARHPRSAEPVALTKAAVEAIREEYKEIEVDDVCETVGGHELKGHDLSFYYLDLTNTACVRAIRGDDATYTVFFQAEDREFTQIQDIFQAMTVSFLVNLRRTGDRE